MLEFYAAPFMATMTDLGRAIRALEDIDADRPFTMGIVAHALSCLERDLPGLPLSPVVEHQFRRLQEAAVGTRSTPAQMRTLLYEFETNLWVDLKQHSYFLVPASCRFYLDEAQEPFGSKTAQRFPEAGRDIAAAGRCMAFEEYTAAVFHLMRVLELGLRNLAGRLGVQMTKLPEYENWHQIITAMENEIARLRNLPKAQRPKSGILDFYAEAAADFRYFKDAWRNDVSHSRDPYDGREAKKVWDHVASFMQCLAEGPS